MQEALDENVVYLFKIRVLTGLGIEVKSNRLTLSKLGCILVVVSLPFVVEM
jgi:hypothetical protein